MRRPFRRARPASFIADPVLGASPTFLQWLAFGTTFTHERMRDAVDWIEQCRHDWLAAHGSDWAHATRPEHLSALRTLHQEVLATALADSPTRPRTLGLSGGFDSRAILSGLWEHASQPILFTYGRPGSIDFDCVTRLADEVGAQVRMFDTTDLDWDRQTLIAAIRTTRDRAVSPRMIVGDRLTRELGPHDEINGYLNGVLTGHHSHGPADATWEAAVTMWAAANDPFSLQAHLSAQSVPTLLEPSPLSTHLGYGAQLEYGLRQAQRLRPQSTPECGFVLPFEDPRWIGAWLNIGEDERRGQSLWASHLQSLSSRWFPDLMDRGPDEPPASARARWLAEGHEMGTRAEAAVVRSGPLRPAAQLCWRTAYRDSPGFRSLVDDSLARLRARRVFDDSFVSRCTQEFDRGRSDAVRSMKGLVSTELALAAGLFDD